MTHRKDPHVDVLKTWLEEQRGKLSRATETSTTVSTTGAA